MQRDIFKHTHTVMHKIIKLPTSMFKVNKRAMWGDSHKMIYLLSVMGTR